MPEYLARRFKDPEKEFIPPSLAAELIKIVTKTNEEKLLYQVWRLARASFQEWRKGPIPPEVALEIYTCAHKMKDGQFLDEMSVYLQKLLDYHLRKVDKANFRNLSEEQIIAIFKLVRLYGYRPYLEGFGETYLCEVISQNKSLPVELLVELSRVITYSKNDTLEQMKQVYQHHFDKDNLAIEDLSVNAAVELRRLAQLVGDGAMVGRIEKVLRGEKRDMNHPEI